jgi:hypothetical protein
MVGGGQWRQRLAELDDIAVAVVPLVEQGEVVFDLGDGVGRAQAPAI